MSDEATLSASRIVQAMRRLTDISDPYPLPCTDWVPCIQTAIRALELVRKIQVAEQYCGEPDDRFGRMVKLLMEGAGHQTGQELNPLVMREVALELRLWQSDLNMPAGYRQRLMALVERLCPELAQEHEAFKQSGGVL